MQILRIKGTTRVLGEAQGYRPLPLRDESVIDSATGKRVNRMRTLWRPTPEELTAMLNGASVVLDLYGDRWPPANLYVDPNETDEPTPTPTYRGSKAIATGNTCPVCGDPQYITSSGITCGKGHGGVV